MNFLRDVSLAFFSSFQILNVNKGELLIKHMIFYKNDTIIKNNDKFIDF